MMVYTHSKRVKERIYYKMAGELSIGMIGCGDIALEHAHGISKAANAKVGMVMDIKEELATEIGETYGVPYSTNLDELLAEDDIDAVYIAIPHHLHAPIAIKAARAGKHIMVEKPIATTLEDADNMIDECHHAGVLLSVCYIWRYKADVIKAQSLVEDGVIGDVFSVSMADISRKPQSYWSGGFSGRTKTDWRGLKEKSGGGILMMNLVHNLDAISYITGLEVDRGFAEYGTFNTPVEVEDTIAVTLRYDNGAVGNILASSVACGEPYSKNNIYGSDGTITLGNPLQVYTTKSVNGIKPNKLNKIKLKQPYLLRQKLVEEFASAALAGKQPPITGEDGRKTLEVILAAYQAGERQMLISHA